MLHPLNFLAATKQLYEWFSSSVRPPVTPFGLSSCHRIIMKFSRVITSDKSDVHANVQGHRSEQVKLDFTDGYEMMHKVCMDIEEMPYCFSRSSIKFQGHRRQKYFHIWPNLSVSRLLLQYKFTNGYEMMHKAWISIEEVPYCCSRSFLKFQCHRGKKSNQSDPIWAFLDCNLNSNSLMVVKWYIKLKMTSKRCLIVFKGHLWHFKFTGGNKSPLLTQFETQSWKGHGRKSLLVFQCHCPNCKVT